MPTGSINSIEHVINIVHQTPKTHRKILDFGCGNGKYGLLLREYLNDKAELLDAIEGTAEYIKEFKWLNCIYDNVYNIDGTFLNKDFFDKYNIVMINDVIEHIHKPTALELIDRITGYIVIVTPSVFFEQSVTDKPLEKHVSHWERKDFKGREDIYYEDKGGIYCRLKPL